MKIQVYISVAAAVLLSAGCSSMNVQQGTGRYDTPGKPSVAEAVIVRSQIPVQVRSTAPVSIAANNVKALVQGELARAGYTVGLSDPFIEIDLYPQFTLRDSFGSYRVYDGFCGLVIRDSAGNVLTKEEVKTTGSRELEDSRAQLSAQEKLAADAAARTVEICNEKTTGVESVLVSFKGRTDAELNLFANRMRSIPGVLSCRRAAEEKNTAQYRVVFDARRFPDGIRQVIERAGNR